MNFAAQTNPQYTDRNGNPLSAGKVEFREAGTVFLKNIYSDAGHTVLAANPMPLNGAGRHEVGVVYPISGAYDILVYSFKNGQYVLEYTSQDIVFEEAPGAPIGAYDAIFSPSVSVLSTITGAAGGLVYTAGYFEPNDDGGGWWVWDEATVAVADGGSVIRPSGVGVGAWLRLFNGTKVYPQYWGAIPNEPLSMDSALTLMSVFAETNGYEAYFSPGTYNLDGSVGFGCPVELAEGVLFTGGTIPSTAAFNGPLVVSQKTRLVDASCALFINTDQKAPVEISWWNVSQGFISDSSTEIMKAINQSADNDIVIREIYTISADTAVRQSGKTLIFKENGALNIEGAVAADPVLQPNLFRIERTGPIILGQWATPIYDRGGGVSFSLPVYKIDMKWFLEDGAVIPATQYISLATRAIYISHNVILDWGDLKVTFNDNAGTIRLPHLFRGAQIIINAGASVRFDKYTSETPIQVFYGGENPIVNQDIDPAHFGQVTYLGSVDHSHVLSRCMDISAESRVEIDLQGREYRVRTGIQMLKYSVVNMKADGRKTVMKNGKIVWDVATTASIFTVRYHGIFRDIEVEATAGLGQIFLLSITGDVSDKGLEVYDSKIKGNDHALVWVGTALSGGVYLRAPALFQNCDIRVEKVTSTESPFPNANFGAMLRFYNNRVERGVSMSVSDIYCGPYCEFVDNKFINDFRIKLEAVPVSPLLPNNPVVQTKVVGNGFHNNLSTVSIIESAALSTVLEGNDATVKDNYLMNPSIAAALPATEGISDSKLVSSIVANPGTSQTITVQANAVLTRGVEYILPRNNAKLSPTATGRSFDADVTEITGYSVGGYDAFVRLLSARINWKQYLAAGSTQYDITYTFSNDTADVNDTIYAWAKFKFCV